MSTLLEGATIIHRDNPSAKEADILVGTRDLPGLDGTTLSVNHKNRQSAFKSGTDFICQQTDDEIERWRHAMNLPGEKAPFAGKSIVIEDASVDTCLSLIALARRLASQTMPDEWAEYTKLWEKGFVDSTGIPAQSLGALLGALVHVELQPKWGDDEGLRSNIYQTALTKGVEYAEGLLNLGLVPNMLPRTLSGAQVKVQQLHEQAHARLTYEEQTYKRVSETATKLQLAVHLNGSNRKTLIDAILFSEVVFTNTLKNFSRTDPGSFTGRGYSLQAIYRPELRGTGDDIVFSTNPSSNLNLKSLWIELERLEEQRWSEFSKQADGFARPRDGEIPNRKLVSHENKVGDILPCHQPWWDDEGAYTLLAAPRHVFENGVRLPGSLLTWRDVKQAIWRCYAPTLGLRVRLRGSKDSGVKLSDEGLQVENLRKALIIGSQFHIVDVERVSDHQEEPLLLSPTLLAAIAAVVEDGTTDIDNLPPQSAFRQIEARGGVAIVTENGIALLKLNASEDFPSDALRRAASEAAQTVCTALEFEQEIRTKIREQVIASINENSGKRKRLALRAIYAAKIHAREQWEKVTRVEKDHFVREFRTLCEDRWQAKARFDAALAEIAELETMVVSASEVRTNTTVNYLAIYGLPASLAGNLLGSLLLMDSKGVVTGLSYHVLLIYAALVLAGIALIGFISSTQSSRWRIDRR